jgi:hypothetical protein
MENVSIAWLPAAKGHISQIYSNGLEYAFATKTAQCTDFIYCKDFLHDCIYASIHKKAIAPHGFKFDPATTTLETKRSHILIANASDPKLGEKVEGCIDFLNQMEKKIKLFRTKAMLCSNSPAKYKGGVFLFRGSGMWLNSPPMLSLYTLCIRIGLCHKVGDDFMSTLDKIEKGTLTPYQKNDKQQLSQCRNGLNAILDFGYRKFFYKNAEKNYPNVDLYTMHASFGIVAFSNVLDTAKPSSTNQMPKYWHRKKVRALIAEKKIAKT